MSEILDPSDYGVDAAPSSEAPGGHYKASSENLAAASKQHEELLKMSGGGRRRKSSKRKSSKRKSSKRKSSKRGKSKKRRSRKGGRDCKIPRCASRRVPGRVCKIPRCASGRRMRTKRALRTRMPYRSTHSRSKRIYGGAAQVQMTPAPRSPFPTPEGGIRSEDVHDNLLQIEMDANENSKYDDAAAN